MTIVPAGSSAYDVIIECAALSVISVGTVGTDEFSQHLRETLREALHFYGAFNDGEYPVNKLEVRRVFYDVVTRVLIIFSQELTPRFSVDPEVDAEAEIALCNSLRATLARVDEICLSED